MALLYPFSDLNVNLTGAAQPIIYCRRIPELENEAISVGYLLAEKLNKISSGMRSMRMEQILFDVLSTLPVNSLIRDFDVLFNPTYRIYVLVVLKNTCKKIPFRVLWPGTYKDGNLYYAEEGYQDYKCYKLSNYDITCII